MGFASLNPSYWLAIPRTYGSGPFAVGARLLPSPNIPRSMASPMAEITGAIGVQLVAGPAGRAFRNELGLHLAGRRVERRGVEIGDHVNYAGRPDECVEGVALVVLLLRAVRSIGGIERARQRKKPINDCSGRKGRSRQRACGRDH